LYTIGQLLKGAKGPPLFVVIEVFAYSVTLYACNTGAIFGVPKKHVGIHFISL